MSVDKVPFTGGRYHGMTPEQVADISPRYIVELHEKDPTRVSRSLYLACSAATDTDTVREPNYSEVEFDR